MKKVKIIMISIIIVLVLVIGYLLITDKKMDSVVNDTSFINSEVDLDNGEEKVDWDLLDSNELVIDESLEITNEGVYTLTGDVDGGNVVVNCTGDVKLILDSVSIKSSDGPAILILSANNVIIELKDGTKNYVSDSSAYSNSDYNGCIHSKSDLIFQGNGSLEVNGNYKDGIVSKDDLKFSSGTYFIKSLDDGIVGKDSIYVVDGDFSIECGSDGLKSSNTEDDTKGFINIDNGKFIINSEEDGIQAETKLIINDGEFLITTSDGSSSDSSAIYKDFYGGSSYDSTSSKGLKAGDNLVIKNGSFTIDSKDDAIHSNNYLGIVNGVIDISSGDDGIHADKEVIIDNGNIKISQSYEGIESENITINGGDISIISSDDGLNVSGGNDQSSVGGRPGQNHTAGNGGTLYIIGGKVYVDASGDGLDANGNIVIKGGEVSVDGPTNSGNGALDYDTVFEITGGDFIAVGSSGMVQGVSSSSSQYSVMFYLNSSYDGDISLVDSSGNEVVSYSPSKKYSSVIISSSSIKKGEEYTLKIDGEEIDTIKVDSVNSSNSSIGGYGNPRGGSGGGPGGSGGGRGPHGR